MSNSINVRDIQAAGGLQKWLNSGAKTMHSQDSQLRPIASAKGKGRLPANRVVGYVAERMNKLEVAYAQELEIMRRSQKIIQWQFEAVKLRLANRTSYTPDFFVMLLDGTLGFHEVKGHWEDDARVKIKVVSEQFPQFFFVAVQWDRKGRIWKYEYF